MSDVLTEFSASLGRLAASAAPGVVCLRGHRTALTGIAVSLDLVVTADDALGEANDISATLPDGSSVAAHIVGRDASTDVALLRLDGAALVPFALPPGTPASIPALGTLALHVGARDGAPTAALGVVSHAGGAWHSLRGGAIDARIEVDLRLRAGGEGGAVLAPDRTLIGMAVAGPRRRTVVIPAATIARVVGVLQRDGRIPRGYLGLGLQPVTLGDGPRSGAMVMNVDPQGPGARAGLLQGDILLTWNDTPIGRIRTLLRSLGGDSVGQTATLTISRAGATREVQLTIGERPGA
jgi:S1-C subfamily serine protease